MNFCGVDKEQPQTKAGCPINEPEKEPLDPLGFSVLVHNIPLDKKEHVCAAEVVPCSISFGFAVLEQVGRA
jgi:hypothetical protein